MWGGGIQEIMKKGERDEVFTEVQHSSNCDVLGFYLNESSQNPVGVSDPYFLPEEAEAQREELAQDYAANEMQSQSPHLVPSPRSWHSHFLPNSLCVHDSLQNQRVWGNPAACTEPLYFSMSTTRWRSEKLKSRCFFWAHLARQTSVGKTAARRMSKQSSISVSEAFCLAPSPTATLGWLSADYK